MGEFGPAELRCRLRQISGRGSPVAKASRQTPAATEGFQIPGFKNSAGILGYCPRTGGDHRRGEDMTTRIGTSGWNYPHWKERFYPAGLPAGDWLAYYAERFSSVEINATFYRLPEEATLDAWRDAVPASFRFAVKASRYITHMKKLKDPQASIARFFARIERLGERLGPVLFQLPPNWHCNAERLAAFLDALPAGYRYAFEFRDESWWTDEVAELLAEHEAAWCLFDLDGLTAPSWTTTDLVYLRLHGSDGPYQGSYEDDALREWASAIRAWESEGRSLHCYFDNDAEAQAPGDAQRLVDCLTGQ